MANGSDNQVLGLFSSDTATKIGRFGAALGGRLSQFDESQRRDEQARREQAQQLDEERQAAILSDSFTVMQQLEAGDVGGALSLLDNRLENIQKLGGDPSDTAALRRKIVSGDLGGALRDVGTVVNFAERRGRLKSDGTTRQIIGQQVVSVDARTGRGTARDIEGLRVDPADQRQAQLREREIALAERRETRQEGKLSAGLEKALLAAQDRTVAAQQEANRFANLASDFERIQLEGGVKSTLSETFKGLLGDQDQVTEFRRQFNQVRLSEGLKNLPPGPATDRDVQEAFKGVPAENASPEQVASFLRGAARLARFEAGFNQFKSDFISENSTGKGINQAWRRKVKAPGFERDISVAEIYETAQNRGMTPGEVAQQLGIAADFLAPRSRRAR